ncbi:MAG: c-type heme family protein [Desulfuromonadaceae bacterium]
METQSQSTHCIQEINLIRYGIIIAVIWSLLIAYSLLWSHHLHAEDALRLGKMQGQAFFEKDILYRRWASRHGGIYVPLTESTRPNPYLAHIPERDISTPSGVQLTLMNPAYMTRQVFEMAQEREGSGRGHITSLKPLRHENAPDPWEKESLLAFERGVSEVGTVATIDGKPYYRYMKSLYADKPCLKCHQSQGYQEGDLRGGLSVSAPMEPIYAMVDNELRGTDIHHAIIWLMGLGIIGFGTRKLDRNAACLHKKSTELEQEVEKRTIAQEQLQEQATILEEEIEEHRRTEQKRQDLSKIIEKSLNEIYIFDAETLKFMYANQEALDNLHYTFDEIVTLTPVDLKPKVTEDSFRTLIQPLRGGTRETIVFQTIHKRADDTTYPVEIHLQLVDSGGHKVFLATIFDITERKHAEAEKSLLEAQLQQAQRMESVGRLAGGVAHDFNNILTVIQGYSQIGLMETDPAQPVFSHLEEIRKASERAANLTHQLLAFARKQTIAPKVLNLNEAVSGMLKMLQRLIGENVQLSWQAGANLWPVKIDPSQVDQLLANLCVNARDAMADVGRIAIETENCAIAADYRTVHGDVVAIGEYVKLTVSDNGSGMSSETLANIFEPFFTTKGIGEGTGLGLSTVFGIVKQNDGVIDVSSNVGVGTTFALYIPRYRGTLDHPPEGSVADLIPCGHETILLVEDDQAILNMATMILSRQGYTVLPANTPLDGIRLAKEHADEINLLVTDVIMPVMNGKDLALDLQSMNPQLKCLFMSGYTADAISQHGVLDETVHFIQKPFSLPNLAIKVREVLDSKQD